MIRRCNLIRGKCLGKLSGWKFHLRELRLRLRWVHGADYKFLPLKYFSRRTFSCCSGLTWAEGTIIDLGCWFSVQRFLPFNYWKKNSFSFALPRRLAEFSRLSLSSNSRTIHHRHQQPKRRARDENLSKQRGWLIEVGSIRAHKASSAEENLISPLGKLRRLEVEVEVLLIDLSGVIAKLRSASFRA